MKKIIKKLKILLIFLIILAISNHVYATTITLEQIVEKFNNSSFVELYKGTELSINATNDDNSITVKVYKEGEGVKETLTLLLDGNILSTEIDKEEGESAFTKAIIASRIIDNIGQLQGYKEGDLLATINSEEAAQNYTLEKEGYEIEETDESKLKIKVDISKKIPLIDFSNEYIEVSDLESLKEFISGDGFAEKSKGNVWFNKNGYNGEYTLLVAEKSKLTESTYKSILSILEVMFDNDKVMEYFKDNYSNISNGDKAFNGFDIKVNPTEKTEDEKRLIPSDSDYEFVRITINKPLAISSANDMNKIESESSTKENLTTQKENKANIDVLPRTGEEKNRFLTALYVIISTCIIGLITLVFTSRNKK